MVRKDTNGSEEPLDENIRLDWELEVHRVSEFTMWVHRRKMRNKEEKSH